MSVPSGRRKAFCRWISFTRRLTRFRITADPTLVETDSPRRFSPPVFDAQKSLKVGVDRRGLAAHMVLKSLLPRRSEIISEDFSATPEEGFPPQTVRRFRPFRRLALRTLRPPGELIRSKKPWTLFRFLRLG